MALKKSLTTSWTITNDKKYIGIPLCPGSFFSSTNLKLHIDWGDGTDTNITDTDASAARVLFHVYDTIGEKTVTIKGGYGATDADRKLAFDSPNTETQSRATRDNLKSINSWEEYYIHGQGDFKNCTILQSMPGAAPKFLLSSNPASNIQQNSSGTFLCISTFEGCKAFNSSTANWGDGLLNCTSMNSMFKNAEIGKPWFGKWKVDNVTDMTSLFEGSNIDDKSIRVWGANNANKLTNVTTMKDMFKNCPFDQHIVWWFRNGPMNVKDMSGMFSGSNCGYGQKSTANKIFHWQMWNVEDVSDMFRDNQHFAGNLANWFHKNATQSKSPNGELAVKNMSGMFANSNFGGNVADSRISQWKMDSVEDTSEMFKDNQHFDWNIASWFKTPPAGGFKIKDMSGMFANSAFGKVYGKKAMLISGWKMDTVEDTSEMFKDNTHFDYFIANWFKKATGKTYVIKNMKGMFSGASVYGESSLRKGQDIHQWDMSSVENVSEMFKDNQHFDYNLENWFKRDGTTYNVTDMSGMFENSKFGSANTTGIRKTKGITSWEMKSVLTTARMFKDNGNIRCNLNNLFHFNNGPYVVTDMSSMFENADRYNQRLNSWGGGGLKTVTNISRMFAGTCAFNQDITAWYNKLAKSGNVRNMSGLFDGNSAFNKDISGWDLSKVENVSYMFANNSKYNWALDGLFADPQSSGLDVTNMEGMFENNTKYNKPLSSWVVNSVTSTKNMFKNSIFDKSIVNWFKDDDNTKNLQIKDMSGMFSGANSAFGSTTQNNLLNKWRTNSVEDMSEMFKDNTNYSRTLRGWDTSSLRSWNDFKTKVGWNKIPYMPGENDASQLETGMDDVTETFDLGTESQSIINFKPAGGNISASKLLVTYQTDVSDTPGYVSVTQPAEGTVELILNNVEDGDGTSSLDSNIDVVFTPNYNTIVPGDQVTTITIVDTNGNDITATLTWTVTDSSIEPVGAPEITSLTSSGIVGGTEGSSTTVSIAVGDSNYDALVADGQSPMWAYEWKVDGASAPGTNDQADYTFLIGTDVADGAVLSCTVYLIGGNGVNDGVNLVGSLTETMSPVSVTLAPEISFVGIADDQGVSPHPNIANGFPDGAQTDLVGVVVSNIAALNSANMTVTESYNWFIDNVSHATGGTFNQFDPTNRDNAVIKLVYSLTANGVTATSEAEFTCQTEGALIINQFYVTPAIDNANLYEGTPVTFTAVVDVNAKIGEWGKAINADSETWAWEISDNSLTTWSPAPGVNTGENISPGVTSEYTLDPQSDQDGSNLRCVYTITNEGDTKTATSNSDKQLMIYMPPLQEDYSVTVADSMGENIFLIGTNNNNHSASWDETDTMYDSIITSLSGTAGREVTKTLNISLLQGTGVDLAFTRDPRGTNNDGSPVEYTTGVTKTADVLSVVLNLDTTPSLWLYDKNNASGNFGGSSKMYFFDVPFSSSVLGLATRTIPTVSITAPASPWEQNSGVKSITIDINDVHPDHYINDIYVNHPENIDGGQSQQAGLWTDGDTGNFIRNEERGLEPHQPGFLQRTYTYDSQDGLNDAADVLLNWSVNISIGMNDSGNNLYPDAEITVSFTADPNYWEFLQPGDAHSNISLIPMDYSLNPVAGVGSDEFVAYLDGQAATMGIGGTGNLGAADGTDMVPYGTWELGDHDLDNLEYEDSNSVYHYLTCPTGKWYKKDDGRADGKYLALVQFPKMGGATPNTNGKYLWTIYVCHDPVAGSAMRTPIFEYGPMLGGGGTYAGHSPFEQTITQDYGYGSWGSGHGGNISDVEGAFYHFETDDPNSPYPSGNFIFGLFEDGHYEGCTTAGSFNYDVHATLDSGSCVASVTGCMEVGADNYDASANVSDDSCTWTNVFASLPATVVSDQHDMGCSGGLAYASTPLTWTKNGGGAGQTLLFTDTYGNVFETDLFYEVQYIDGMSVSYSAYMAYNENTLGMDENGNSIPAYGAWHIGDDNGQGGSIYWHDDNNNGGMGGGNQACYDNRRSRLSPVGNYDEGYQDPPAVVVAAS